MDHFSNPRNVGEIKNASGIGTVGNAKCGDIMRMYLEYFVLTGCTAGIIGDDIVSVTNEFSENGIPVYPIEPPGFAGDSNLGYEIVWNYRTKNYLIYSFSQEHISCFWDFFMGRS